MKKKHKKLPGWVILPIIAALLLSAFLLSKIAKPAQSAATLAVVPVQRGDVREEYNTSGTVESEKTKTFYSPVNATVDTCSAVVGQTVHEGDLLISFDTRDLEQNNRQSQLNLEATRAGNQSTREQALQSASLAALSQADLDRQIDDTRQKICDKQDEIDILTAQVAEESAGISEAASQKAAQLSELNRQLTASQNDAGEIRKKQNENTTTQNTLNAQLQSAQILLNAAAGQTEKEELTAQITDLFGQLSVLQNEAVQLKSDYELLDETCQKLSGQIDALLGESDGFSAGEAAQQLAGARTELNSLQSALEQLENTHITPAGGITDGQQKNMDIQENLAALANMSAQELVDLGKSGIHAAFSGIIAEVSTAQGTNAMQGGALFTLASNTEVGVRLEVPSGDFDKLKVGSTAAIKIGAYTYQGTLTSIDKIATTNLKGNPVIGARLHIDNPDDNIYIGVTAKVNMAVAEAKDVLCLPNEIINTGTDGDFVYVIRDGLVKKQVVELGITSGSTAEIKSGLKEGDEVVADVSATLEEGMRAVGAARTKS